MFEAALETVLNALKPRLQSGQRWRASAAALHSLVQARKAPVNFGVRKEVAVSPDRVQFVQAAPQKRAGESVPAQNSALGGPEVALERESRVMRLRELEKKTAGCRACFELAGSRTQVVRGGGNVEAEVLFVEDAPSPEQDAAGDVSAGEASELLDKMLRAMGLMRADVFVVNVLRCLPPALSGETFRRRPSIAELDACRVHMEELVRIVHPRVIVALGAGAARGLLGTQEPVARLRSQWHAFMEIPVMPTFHPAYLIENPDVSNKRKVWEDLLLVMEKLGLPISAKQRAFFLR